MPFNIQCSIKITIFDFLLIKTVMVNNIQFSIKITIFEFLWVYTFLFINIKFGIKISNFEFPWINTVMLINTILLYLVVMWFLSSTDGTCRDASRFCDNVRAMNMCALKRYKEQCCKTCADWNKQLTVSKIN